MDDRGGTLSISDVSARSGVRPSALRYYEDEGLISSSARIGGRRHYDPSVLRRLAIIALCQEVGFTVAELRQLLGSGRGAKRRWRVLAERKLEEIDAHIEKARATRELLTKVLECGCGDPAACEMTTGAAERRLLSIESR